MIRQFLVEFTIYKLPSTMHYEEGAPIKRITVHRACVRLATMTKRAGSAPKYTQQQLPPNNNIAYHSHSSSGILKHFLAENGRRIIP